jgi:putative drug exporter of the RND superfamily
VLNARRPTVERIACWSARHRKAVIGAWLLLLGVTLLAGQLLGSQSRPQYDPGPAGRGEQVLHQLGVVTPPAESVLIQARASGGRGRQSATFASDPQMRQAAQAVVAALGRLPRAAGDIA